MKSKGFTLIELMIVVAIIAVLAAIALPAYQDYMTRSQVSEGISLATGARVAIATYYGDTGQFPTTNADVGLPPPQSINGRYVSSVSFDNTGSIIIQYNASANAKLQGQALYIRAFDNHGSLRWECGGLDNKYLPSTCR